MELKSKQKSTELCKDIWELKEIASNIKSVGISFKSPTLEWLHREIQSMSEIFSMG